VHASTVNAAAVGAAASSEDQLATNERTTPAAEIGELWVDDTISVDDRDRPVAYEAVLNTMLDASPSVGVRVWLVHAFGEEPWREAPFQRMQVPVWQRPACEAPSEASQIFKLQRANQQQQCDERIRAAERLHRQQVDHQLVAVRDALIQHQPLAAHCTSVGDLLERVAQAPGRRLIVIISDGVETCRRDGLPIVTQPSTDVRVAFVLVGSEPRQGRRGSTLAEQFAMHRDALMRAASWLHVVTPWEVTPGMFGAPTLR